MKKILLILTFFLAFILRFFQLGLNPVALDWDEASLGYNAYSILKTGKDEYGHVLPLSIRSFGDYKPPLYTYTTILPVAVNGLNEFSVRLPSSIFGTLTVIVAYFLIKKLFSNKHEALYLLFTFLFAVSPWHIQFSRIAFEANIALFWFVVGIYLLLKGLEKGIFLSTASFAFVLSMYAYHSPRLLIPLLFISFVGIYWQTLKQKIPSLILSICILSLLVLPIFLQLKSATGARLGSVTLFNPNERLGQSLNETEYDNKRNDPLGKILHNRRIVYAREALGGYLDHFNFDFLFLNGDPPGRHHAVQMGMLYLWDFPFVVIGILIVLNLRSKSSYFLFMWFLLAPLASSITTGTPHAVRAIFYLPTYQIFIAFGLLELSKILKTKKSIIKNMGVGLIWVLFVCNFYYYLRMYYIHTPKEDAISWQYGYKQAVQEASIREKDYDKILVTYKYDQPYIFFLFYQQEDPEWYQATWTGTEIQRANRSYGKYEFRNIEWDKDKNLKNTLIITEPGEIPQNVPILKKIMFPNGTPAFKIVGT